jgi:LmbE family N-acetylglucosaminyl deacetylase
MATLEQFPFCADEVERSLEPAVAIDEALWRDNHQLAKAPVVPVETLIAADSRAVIVAPHPDDEVLGCAGLLMHLSRRGNKILLVAVSDGERSHSSHRSHSSESAFSADLLSRVRPAETTQALLRLGVAHITIVRAHLPDSGLAQHRAQLQDLLGAYLQSGDTVFASWRRDGHPDHEAVGEASGAAARAIGCRLIEIPIWMWHWRRPDHHAIPWQRARKLALDEAMQARKKAALACYRSQLEPDRSTGNAPILPSEVLAHFHRPFEIYFV